MLTTTLNAILKECPCFGDWEKLLHSLGQSASFAKKSKTDNKKLSLMYILENTGVEFAIWCLQAVEGYEKEKRLFAADCAESVLHIFEELYLNDDRPRKAIATARQFANGEITEEELGLARKNAYDAARAAAWTPLTVPWAARAAVYAAYVVPNDTLSAAYAAAYAARTQEREKQAELFRKHFG